VCIFRIFTACFSSSSHLLILNEWLLSVLFISVAMVGKIYVCTCATAVYSIALLTRRALLFQRTSARQLYAIQLG
jgi:hypothetical protein